METAHIIMGTRHFTISHLQAAEPETWWCNLPNEVKELRTEGRGAAAVSLKMKAPRISNSELWCLMTGENRSYEGEKERKGGGEEGFVYFFIFLFRHTTDWWCLLLLMPMGWRKFLYCLWSQMLIASCNTTQIYTKIIFYQLTWHPLAQSNWSVS